MVIVPEDSIQFHQYTHLLLCKSPDFLPPSVEKDTGFDASPTASSGTWQLQETALPAPVSPNQVMVSSWMLYAENGPSNSVMQFSTCAGNIGTLAGWSWTCPGDNNAAAAATTVLNNLGMELEIEDEKVWEEEKTGQMPLGSLGQLQPLP